MDIASVYANGNPKTNDAKNKQDGPKAALSKISELRECLECALEFLDEVVGDARRDDAGHVLDADRVATHFFQLDGQGDERFDGMDRAGGITKFAAGVFAALDDRLDRGEQVARVVERVEDRPRKQPVEPRLGLGAVLGPDEHVDGLEVRDAAQELLDQHGADVTRPSREEDRGAGEGGGERWLRCFFCFLEREREKKKRETLANERGQKREREGEEGRRLEKELSKNTTGTARGRDAGEPGACGFFFSSLLFIRSSAVLAPPRRALKFRFCRTERCFVTIRSIDCK